MLRISDRDDGHAWEMAEVVRSPADRRECGAALRRGPGQQRGRRPDRLGIVGRMDRARRRGRAASARLTAPKGLRVFAIADLNGDGRLDLAGLSDEGRPARGLGRGTKGYHWQVIRPRGAKTFGDGRINSFGVGGEVEVRAGLLVQKQMIAGPILHFGLGDQARPTSRGSSGPTGPSRRSSKPRPTRRSSPSSGSRVLPVPVRLRRDRGAIRHRLHLAIAAGPPNQRPGHRGRRPDRGLGEDPRRPTRPAGRVLRRPDHRRAVGDALLGPRRADGRRSSEGDRDLR